jgi:two-component system chemotaxis response regulator CheB
MNLRVLIVDDTIVYRKIVSDALSTIPEIEVVGTANNGKIALSRIKALKPDLITLDIEMPEMNGLEVLETIKKESLDVGAIVLSHLTLKGGDLTIKALGLGAFDFITKPEGASMAENMESIKKSLAPLLKAYAHQKEIKSILKGMQVSPSTLGNPQRASMVDMESMVQRMRSIAGRLKSEVIGIGISTGGPNALNEMLPRINPNSATHAPHIYTVSCQEP